LSVKHSLNDEIVLYKIFWDFQSATAHGREFLANCIYVPNNYQIYVGEHRSKEPTSPKRLYLGGYKTTPTIASPSPRPAMIILAAELF